MLPPLADWEDSVPKKWCKGYSYTNKAASETRRSLGLRGYRIFGPSGGHINMNL